MSSILLKEPPVRRINHCLNTRLIDICKRAIQLDELNTKLQAFLPNELKAHCQVGSFNLGCLTIIVDDAVWSSQLRYLLPNLRDHMRTAGVYQLTSAKCMVATLDHPTPNRSKQQRHSLSSKARSTITAASEECTYPPLKQALMSLASQEENL